MTKVVTNGLAAFWLMCSVAGLAQNEPPSFRVTTRLVDLTIVAVDKSGNPVTDLKKEDFSVFDNGKSRDIALYRYEGSPAAPISKPAPRPAFVYTNRIESNAAEERNITALVLDAINTDPRDQMSVKGQTARLLRTLAPQTRVAIYQMGREFRVIHDFTDDMASLRARLQELSLEFPAQSLNDVEKAAQEADALLDQIEARKTHYAEPVFRALQMANSTAIAGDVNSNSAVRGSRAESTLAALETLGKHLAVVPGRKSVIWISGGFSILTPHVSTAPNGIPVNPMAGNNLAKAIRKTSERLAQFGVALYAVDAHGLSTSAEMVADRQDIPLLPGRNSEVERAAGENSDSRAAFSLMTSITGGRFIFGSNDFAEGVKRVADDLHGSYSIGFYTPDEPDDKWHALKVTVRRPNVQLLYKEGFRLDPSPFRQRVWDAAAERSALLSPFASNAIRLNAHCAPSAGSAPGTLLLTLQIEAEDIQWREESERMLGAVEIYIGERTADGKVSYAGSRINAHFLPQQMKEAKEHGLPFRRELKPAADSLSLRVLVRDPATGLIGTIDIPLSRTAATQ